MTENAKGHPDSGESEPHASSLRDRVAELGASALTEFDSELGLLLLAVEAGEPDVVDKLGCFVGEWSYSAAVIKDFGGVDELRRAREDAASHATPLDEALDRLRSA